MSKYDNNNNQISLQGYRPRFGIYRGVRRTLTFDRISNSVIMTAKSGKTEQVPLSDIAFLKKDTSYLLNGKLMKSFTTAVDIHRKVRFAFTIKNKEQEYVKFLDLLTKSINAERRVRYGKEILSAIATTSECIFYVSEKHKSSYAVRYWWFIYSFWFAPLMFVALCAVVVVALQLFIIYFPDTERTLEEAFGNFVRKLFGLK